MRDAIEQGGGHFGITEHGDPSGPQTQPHASQFAP